MHAPAPLCQAFNVSAGSLTILDKQGKPIIRGVPTGMAVQVAPVGAPWPNTTAGNKPRCVIKAPGRVKADRDKTWDFTTCGRCLQCLKELGFDCHSGTSYKIRLSAVARKTARWRDSAWSDEYVFKPKCERKALTCYPKP